MKAIKGIFFSVIFTSLAAIPTAKAAITITDFVMTSNSVSFNISGTMPNQAPPEDFDYLWFVNPNVSANPGFILLTNSVASSKSFTAGSLADVRTTTARPNGNYFSIRLSNPLSTGQTLSGSFNAIWSSAVFDPSAITSLNLYWGDLHNAPQGQTVVSGTYLTPVAVPEPSSMAFFGLAALGGYLIRRKKA